MAWRQHRPLGGRGGAELLRAVDAVVALAGKELDTRAIVVEIALMQGMRIGAVSEVRLDLARDAILMAGHGEDAIATASSASQIDAAIERIQDKLLNTGAKEVQSTRLGELVMRELKRLDKVAYIRFASVYRSFADIESFESALKELK